MTAPRTSTPPRTTELLLEALGAESGFREALVGDMAEEFASRVERDGAGAARRWYRREALRAAPHLLRDWTRRAHARDVRYLTGVALSAYVLTAAIGWFVVLLAYGVISALGVTVTAPPSAGGNTWLLLLALMAGLVSAPTAGYIAASLGRRAPLVCALALGGAWSCLTFAAQTIGGGMPLWFRIAVVVVVLSGTALGGALRVVASARSQTPASTS